MVKHGFLIFIIVYGLFITLKSILSITSADAVQAHNKASIKVSNIIFLYNTYKSYYITIVKDIVKHIYFRQTNEIFCLYVT